jgi:hypothetical protein
MITIKIKVYYTLYFDIILNFNLKTNKKKCEKKNRAEKIYIKKNIN